MFDRKVFFDITDNQNSFSDKFEISHEISENSKQREVVLKCFSLKHFEEFQTFRKLDDVLHLF